jgi:membrane protease YdiL (CAAX protease family)
MKKRGDKIRHDSKNIKKNKDTRPWNKLAIVGFTLSILPLVFVFLAFITDNILPSIYNHYIFQDITSILVVIYILCFLSAPGLALIFNIIALENMNKDKERGRKFAIAGIIIVVIEIIIVLFAFIRE